MRQVATTAEWRKQMGISRGFGAVAIVAGLLLAGTTQAADTGSGKGSPEAARAMLERAVAAVKANETKALVDFRSGTAGFRDHDLYVFCARSNGTVDAHVDPTQIGRNIKDLYDVDGVAFGQEMMALAREGEIKAISYMWPEPASHVPTAKVTFFTRVANQMCGVGYYK
jgi:signal transduction histidine kinase